MGVAIWVTNPSIFLLRRALWLSDALPGQCISWDASWQWHSRLPLRKRHDKSWETQPLQTAWLREKGAEGLHLGQGCVTSCLVRSGKYLA